MLSGLQRNRTRLESSIPSDLAAKCVAICATLLACLIPTSALAQDYIQEIGRPTFTSAEPVELGFVNGGNGDLHLEIPLGSFPQRGGHALSYKLVYDSRIWSLPSSTWAPNPWATTMGGWRFVSSADTGGPVGYGFWSTTCGGSPPTGSQSGYNNFYWTAPDGTVRYFGGSTTTNSGGSCGTTTTSTTSGYALDSSGYYMTVTNYNQVVTVTAPDGTQVYPTYKDSNGNYFSKVSGNIVDTLGRTPVTVTNPCAANQICYDVLNSQGSSRSRVTVTTTSIPVHTNFGQQFKTEFSGNLTVLQSISLPDGTSYQFGYDSGSTAGHYGDLTSVTLPTSATVAYGYTVYQDAASTMNHWVSQRTSGGHTWTYALSNVNPSSKTQSVTVTQPSGDFKTYSFTLNNGAWRNSVSYSTGMNVSENWDTSNSCQAPCSGGSVYIRKQTETTSLLTPIGTVTRKRQFTYNGLNTLNPSSIKDWDYYTGTAPTNPTRVTNITYLSDNNTPYTTANILGRPTSIIVTDGSGTKLKETDYAYDEASTLFYTGATIVQHDTAFDNTGVTVRGNRTSIKQWLSGSTYLTTASVTYDTTGQMLSAKDANSNQTTFSYTDCFLTGNPPTSYTPAQRTNAYLTTTTLPVSGTLTACYYYNSGKTAWTKDQNGATTSHYFVNSGGSNDAFDRETKETLPIGWALNNYTSQTQLDSYIGIQDSTASTSCSSCRHDKALRDTLGRPTDQVLVGDPDGQTTVHTDYDVNGRVLDTSHPYRTTSDSTYGFETMTYDGQSRPTRVTHQDGTSAKTYYGATVAAPGGVTMQMCSGCDVGYPTLSVDEAGKARQVWTNALGKTVEVDEPAKTASPGGTTATGTVSFSGSEQSTTITCGPSQCTVWDGGQITVTVGGVSEPVVWQQGSTSALLASSLASAFNSNPASPVSATVSGSTVTFTGLSNYSLSVVTNGWNTQYFTQPSFTGTPSGSSLTGGSSPQMASPTVTYYLYDLLGNLTQVTTGGSQECNRTYTYDALSRMTSATEPEPGNGSGTCPLNSTHTTNFYYTKSDGTSCSGNPSLVCRRTDGRSITTTYTYDTLNRLTGMTYSDGTTPAVTYSYDQTTFNGLTITNGKGRRTGMSDGSGTTAWSYDANGNALIEKRTITGITKIISYAYNNDNSLKSLTYPSGRVINFAVSNAQRVTNAIDTDGTQYVLPPATGAMYAPTGAISSAVYGKGTSLTNGLIETRTYNNRLQLTGIQNTSSAGTPLNLSFTFGTTNNGEIASIPNNLDSGRTQTFTYDDLSRVLTASSQATTGTDCWGQSFTIDAVANLTGVAVTKCSSTALSASVNGNNQFTGNTYDAAGNMTSDGTYTYTYNAENELTTANGATYTYDGNRVRVKKTGGMLYFRTIAGDVIAETNLSGATTNEYVIFSGRKIARRDSSGSAYYYQTDQLGSTRTGIQSNGTLCYDADFTPYGQEMQHTNTCVQKYKFTGYERDSETGLDYAANRYYNSRLGRFMSADPLGLASGDFYTPQSMNQYAYVQNNPVRFVDPSGLYCVWDDGSYDDDFSEGGAGSGACASQGGTWFDGFSAGASYSPDEQMSNEVAVAQALGLAQLTQAQQQTISQFVANNGNNRILTAGIVMWKMKNRLVDTGDFRKNFIQKPERDPLEELFEEMKKKGEFAADVFDVIINILKNGGTMSSGAVMFGPPCFYNHQPCEQGPEL